MKQTLASSTPIEAAKSDGAEHENNRDATDPSDDQRPPQDPDADGLNDDREDLNGNGRVDEGETNPLDPDTDRDGLSDGAERRYGTNPLVPDTDQDGLLDGVEDRNGNGVHDPHETHALEAGL